MVSEPDLTGGPRFEPPLCNLFLICLFESPRKTMFDLFDSPRANMGPHVRECVKKHDIHSKLKSYKFKLLGELVTRTFVW